jgi:hypothetical protein
MEFKVERPTVLLYYMSFLVDSRNFPAPCAFLNGVYTDARTFSLFNALIPGNLIFKHPFTECSNHIKLFKVKVSNTKSLLA